MRWFLYGYHRGDMCFSLSFVMDNKSLSHQGNKLHMSRISLSERRDRLAPMKAKHRLVAMPSTFPRNLSPSRENWQGNTSYDGKAYPPKNQKREEGPYGRSGGHQTSDEKGKTGEGHVPTVGVSFPSLWSDPSFNAVELFMKNEQITFFYQNIDLNQLGWFRIVSCWMTSRSPNKSLTPWSPFCNTSFYRDYVIS